MVAGSKSNYFENRVLDYFIGKAVTSTAPATLYMTLWNTTLNDTKTGASTGECVGTGYARKAITNSSANWTNAVSGAKENKTVIQFTASAGAGWGTIKAAALTDSITVGAGNIFYWGDLTVQQVVSSGNTVQFSTGAVDITED